MWTLADFLTCSDRAFDRACWRLAPRTVGRIEAELDDFLRRDTQASQILYYWAVSPDARRIHGFGAREIGVQGGNKSAKTDTLLAEDVIQMTGLVPMTLAADYPRHKLRPPIRVRLVVTSLTTAWDINLKPKLQWWEWNGRLNADGLPGDPRYGHWGWIPQSFLVHGDWEASWSEKHRLLTLTNGSTLQVMSHDQALEDFNQGAFHLIHEDEIPPEDIHRANRVRVMEYGGQILTAGTPPDDRSASVTAAWFFDQLIAPGLAGSNPEKTQAITLWTEHNRILDPADVQAVTDGLTDEQRRVRLHGEPIHLAGLVYPDFTEKGKVWCVPCAKPVLGGGDRCGDCGRADTLPYSNVWTEDDLPWPGPVTWPTLFYMDPHQSRPTACAWIKVDPMDCLWQVAEQDILGDAAVVKRACEHFEQAHGLWPTWRKGDPKMTEQVNRFATKVEGQDFTIRRAFEEVGFDFLDAQTNFTVGRERVLQWLRPDPLLRRPRLRVHESCTRTIYQMTHFVWDPGGRRTNVDKKEVPARRDSDFPALLRYLANDAPTWRGLQYLRDPRPVILGAGGLGRNPRTGW